MKKKFIVFTLCFTIIFSSINFRKSYADGGVISLPLLSTVSSLAVASGLVLNSDNHIYDLGRGFYDYIDKHNDLTWDTVTATFYSGVTVLNNGFVSVDSKFLDVVKGFFNDTFNSSYAVNLGYVSDIPVFSGSNFNYIPNFYSLPLELNESGKVSLSNGYYISFKKYSSGIWMAYYSPSAKLTEVMAASSTMNMFILHNPDNNKYYLSNYNDNGTISITGYLFNFPFSPIGGDLNWDNVESKKENDKSIALPIPGNLGQLVGQSSSDFWDNTDNLVGTGDIIIPSVDAPSIGFDDVISFPNAGDVPDVDVPSDTPFSNITDYIISLVVPSDSYWTDTFGGLYNNFTNSFPMVDLDNFNNLVTGEKKFPNIDINIMGVKGRVVNGDVINSIVDWLRPIIAGFMMLCLMLFNYRKIYKTIRGVEPFQGIAQGTSDFRTGISEYNYMGTGLSKSDYDANEKELAKALHDYYEDTGKTYKVKI